MAEHTADADADRTTRRSMLAGLGAAGLAGVAGCLSGGGESTDGSGGNSGPLEAGGSSTVFPIMSGETGASGYWNANRPASDSEYWPHDEYGIDTDKNLADYWGGLYGFEPGDGGDAPFEFSVSLSHSGTGIEKCSNGQVDIGNASGSVADEKPDWSQKKKDKFVNHVVGVDGQPLVVSKELAKDIDKITGQQLKDLYKGRIDNWSEIGGPDKEVRVLGRVKDSGTRTSFVSNVFDDPQADTKVDNRFGQNQRLAQAVADADNAISYLALAFINTAGVAPVALEWEGTTYAYQDDQNGLDSKEYPLSRDLHAYTWKDTSKKEAAVLRMVLSDFGQATFVEPNNYFKLSKRRQQEELDKLPDTEN